MTIYIISPLLLFPPPRLTIFLSTFAFLPCPAKIITVNNHRSNSTASHSSNSNIIPLRVRVSLHDYYIYNVIDEGLLAGSQPSQGGYYPQQPQQPQQAYQGGYAGQPGYQPQPQPQVVYV